MPRTTIVDIPPLEQARMLAELRRARYGYLLALHLLLLCTVGHTPSGICQNSPQKFTQPLWIEASEVL